jgi:hypothetical protein
LIFFSLDRSIVILFFLDRETTPSLSTPTLAARQPQLTGIDEKQEMEASGRPNANPSVLEVDYVEGSTPKRSMVAPTPRAELPQGGHAGGWGGSQTNGQPAPGMASEKDTVVAAPRALKVFCYSHFSFQCLEQDTVVADGWELVPFVL